MLCPPELEALLDRALRYCWDQRSATGVPPETWVVSPGDYALLGRLSRYLPHLIRRDDDLILYGMRVVPQVGSDAEQTAYLSDFLWDVTSAAPDESMTCVGDIVDAEHSSLEDWAKAVDALVAEVQSRHD